MLVVAFTVAFLNSRSAWTLDTHILAGYSAGILMVARIIWGLTMKGYCNFSRFPFQPKEGLIYAWKTLTGQPKRYIGHNPAGSLVIYGMLTVGLLTVATGVLVNNDAYLPWASSYTLHDIHRFCSWSWLALVITHISGVVMESVLHKENLIATMFTGVKQRHLDRKHKAEPVKGG